jgi:hypothetical protein
LSCLKGNFHEQFLGGWAGAIPPGYPAMRKQARRHCALSLPNTDCLQPPLRCGFRQQLKAGVRLQLQIKGVSTEFGASRDP